MVTPQHLTRLFRRHIQTTPMRYLWQRRTRHGVELLGGTGLSITEIADRIGFQSPFHFSRLVLRYYHDSPRRLRERLWSGHESSRSLATPDAGQGNALDKVALRNEEEDDEWRDRDH